MMSSPARDLLESFLTEHPEVPGALVHIDAQQQPCHPQGHGADGEIQR